MRKINKSAVIVFLTILVSTICLLISYPWMYDTAEQSKQDFLNYDQNTQMIDRVFEGVYGHYYELKQSQDEKLKPYQLFVDESKQDLSIQSAQIISDIILNRTEYFKAEYPNIQYYVQDNKTNETLTNAKEPNSLIDLLKNKESSAYAWYIAFTFDENGILTKICYSQEDGAQKSLSSYFTSAMKELFYSQQVSLITSNSSGNATVSNDGNEYKLNFSSNNDNYALKPIQSTTYVYAMDQATLSQMLTVYNVDSQYDYIVYESAIAPIIAIILFFMVLFLGIVKIDFNQRIPLYKPFKRIPVELHAFFTCTLLIMSASMGMIVKFTMEGKHSFFIGGSANNSALEQFLLYGVENFLIWFLIFAYFTYCILMIKDLTIHHTWRKHTYVLGFAHYLKHKFSGLKYFIQHFDLSNKDDKRLFYAVLINFLILSFITVFWGFGIFLLIIYSILLFHFARKYLHSIRKDYRNLLDVTKRMASGDLNSTVETDLGVFNDFKEDMVDIREGFRTAVEEEVQSQRMKTELISNVSHDLKTPLTSIITYVDLFKKDDVSEADRKKYLDTLDRNSIRLKHLIEDLFEISKANSGNINLETMQMDICALMKQVQVELDDKLQKQHLQIKNTFSDEKIIIELDPQKTYRVFENLINNVAKYALKGTRVYIDINDYMAYVEVVIKNVSASELNFDPEEIMERFTRGDASRNTEGSGLGLAIVKSFTELQGGKLGIQIDGDLFKVSLRFPKAIEADDNTEE